MKKAGKKVKGFGNKSNIFFLGLLLTTMTFNTSCGEGNEDKAKEEQIEIVEANVTAIDSKRAMYVESIIRSSPTLAETSDIFGSVGTEFNRDYLNEMENISKYTTLKAQGINLGAYLADLGYITSFEQSQEVIFYMNCAQKMAEGIGVIDVFDEKTVERMEVNINDKDSLLAMISDLYWKTDAFLKELGRQNISALIICGAWVEAMHIGGQILGESDDNEMIYIELKAQKMNLKKILILLSTFEDDENIDYFEEKLSDIYTDYETIGESDEISEEQETTLKVIAQKVETLRNEVTTP